MCNVYTSMWCARYPHSYIGFDDDTVSGIVRGKEARKKPLEMITHQWSKLNQIILSNEWFLPATCVSCSLWRSCAFCICCHDNFPIHYHWGWIAIREAFHDWTNRTVYPLWPLETCNNIHLLLLKFINMYFSIFFLLFRFIMDHDVYLGICRSRQVSFRFI